MSFPPPLHQQQNLVVNNPTDSTDELSQLSVCSGALPTACFLPPVQYFPVDVLPRGDYGSTLHGDDYSSTVSPWVFRAIESLPQLGVGNLPLSPQWTLEVDKVWEMLEGDKENYCLPHPVATSNPPQAYNFDTNNNYQSPPDHLPNADFHSPVVSLPLVPPPSPQLSNPPSTVAGVGNNWKRPLLESDFADVPSIVGTPHGLSQSMESEPEAHDPTDAMDAGFPFRETGDGLCVCGWMDSSGRPCGVSVRANYIKQHVQRVHLQLRPFHCTFCDHRFFTRYSCSTHENIHTGIKPHSCGECEMSFPTTSARSYHRTRFHSADATLTPAPADDAHEGSESMVEF